MVISLMQCPCFSGMEVEHPQYWQQVQNRSQYVIFLLSALAINSVLLHDIYYSVLNFCLISHTFIPYFHLGRMLLEVRGSVLFVQLQDLPICFIWALAVLGIGINHHIGRKPVGFFFLLRIVMMQQLITWTWEPGCIDLNLHWAIYMLMTVANDLTSPCLFSSLK